MPWISAMPPFTSSSLGAPALLLSAFNRRESSLLTKPGEALPQGLGDSGAPAVCVGMEWAPIVSSAGERGIASRAVARLTWRATLVGELFHKRSVHQVFEKEPRMEPGRGCGGHQNADDLLLRVDREHRPSCAGPHGIAGRARHPRDAFLQAHAEAQPETVPGARRWKRRTLKADDVIGHHVFDGFARENPRAVELSLVQHHLSE